MPGPWHGYGLYYTRHLAEKRFRRRAVMEIGVGGYEERAAGGSLRYWRDFFPRATSVGMDIHQKDIDLGNRVRFVRGDQSSAADLARSIESLGAVPEIVIDDGSHDGRHTWASFEYLFPRMPTDGVYVIEDLHTSYWEDFEGAIPAPEGSGLHLVQQAVSEVQLNDPTFWRRPEWGPTPPAWKLGGVAGVHVYPGVAFIVRS